MTIMWTTLFMESWLRNGIENKCALVVGQEVIPVVSLTEKSLK